VVRPRADSCLCDKEFGDTGLQLAIFQAISFNFFKKKTRFPSKGRISSIFGGHRANEPVLSPSISLIVFTTPPQYFAVSQYHTTPLLRCLSVAYHPILRYLSVPNHLRVCQNASSKLHTHIQPLLTYDQYPVTLDTFLSGQCSH
jgi:hypothetical protein